MSSPQKTESMMDVDDNNQMAPTEKSIINRYLNTPMLCRESTKEKIPISLMVAYLNAGAKSETDAFVVVLDVLMSEVGLQRCRDTNPSALIASGKVCDDVYKWSYYHPNHPECLCQLVCSSLDKFVFVHGVMDCNESSESIHANFQRKKYIRTGWSAETEPENVYKDLASLSQKFKDWICFPLLQEIGVMSEASLMGIPEETKIFIFCRLDVHSLTALSQVCSDFNQLINQLINDDALWKKLCLRDFKTKCNDARIDNWKQHYKNLYLAWRCERRAAYNRAKGRYLSLHGFKEHADFMGNPYYVQMKRQGITEAELCRPMYD